MSRSAVRSSVRRFLGRRLRLRVNDDKRAVRTPDRLHFLGFRFTVEADGGVEVYLSARTRERLKARIRNLTPYHTWYHVTLVLKPCG